MKCEYCGKELSDNAKVCRHCGAGVSGVSPKVKREKLEININWKSVLKIAIPVLVVLILVSGIVIHNINEANAEVYKEVKYKLVVDIGRGIDLCREVSTYVNSTWYMQDYTEFNQLKLKALSHFKSVSAYHDANAAVKVPSKLKNTDINVRALYLNYIEYIDIITNSDLDSPEVQQECNEIYETAKLLYTKLLPSFQE